jgi:hypothetical protein
MRYDPASQLVEQLFRVEESDDVGASLNVNEGSLLQYHFRPNEVQALLSRCGYKLEAVYGDQRRGLVQATGERIWVAQKRMRQAGWESQSYERVIRSSGRERMRRTLLSV